MTSVSSRPILFNGEMVRAILAGCKTQTRRVLKRDKLYNGFAFDDPRIARACPYGKQGDRLWARESMKQDSAGVWTYSADGEIVGCNRADESQMISWVHHKEAEHCPSIHMPRWASRITLEITGVRVQRVQDIHGQDARAEGCEPDWDEFNERTLGREGWDEPVDFVEECEAELDWVNYGHELVKNPEHRQWERDRTDYALCLAYQKLWDAINFDRGYGWDTNPWVWVIEFKRLEGNA